MSQPRRRRRRRRKPSDGGAAQAGDAKQAQESGKGAGQPRAKAPKAGGAQAERTTGSTRRARGRRRRRRSTPGERPAQTLEEIVRTHPDRQRPDELSAPADGQDLDEIIGELQSTWGVPQYPQEYRITLKVAEERNGRNGGQPPKPAPAEDAPGGVKREKAPAAPRVAGAGDAAAQERPAKRRRSRRRRKRSSGGGQA